MTATMPPEQRCAIVTGGASGIGAATVWRFRSGGIKVLIADRDAERGAALAIETGADFFAVDMACPDAIEAMIGHARALFGGVDILVNNAGVGGAGGPTPDLDPAVWRTVMAVNIDAVFHTCRHAIPIMRARGGGVIVNTASISGLGGDYGFTAYNASKAALINYTRSLALDHARDNIRVNALCPGLIDTALTARLDHMPELVRQWHALIPMGRAGTADEMAAVIAFLVSDDASYLTGSVIVADGGITAGTGQPNVGAFAAG